MNEKVFSMGFDKPVERMDYYNIPETFKQNINVEQLLIQSRYKIAADIIRGSVLEIGCAFGSGAKLLRELGAKHIEYIGLDIDPEAINIARIEYHSFGSFVIGNAESLEMFSNEKFDYVICFENIEHVYNPRNALKEMNRVLKPNGRLILSTPNRANWGVADDNEFHLRHYSLQHLKGELEECGFDAESVKGIYLFIDKTILYRGLRKLGIPISRLINRYGFIHKSLFFLGKIIPQKSRLLLGIFKKRNAFPSNRLIIK